jgi:hypothetical protein
METATQNCRIAELQDCRIAERIEERRKGKTVGKAD